MTASGMGDKTYAFDRYRIQVQEIVSIDEWVNVMCVSVCVCVCVCVQMNGVRVERERTNLNNKST